MIVKKVSVNIAGHIISHLVYGMFYRFLLHGGQDQGQMQQQSKKGHTSKAIANPITQAPR
jgi:hypothetical protein